MPSASLKPRSENIGSHEIASTSVPVPCSAGSRSRRSVSSLLQTLLNTAGKNTSATRLRSRNRDSVTAVPCWSRSSKSGAVSPTSNAIAQSSESSPASPVSSSSSSSASEPSSSLRLRILPVALRGSSSRNSISRGTL